MLLTRRGSNPQSPDHQLDAQRTEPPRLSISIVWVIMVVLSISKFWKPDSYIEYIYRKKYHIYPMCEIPKTIFWQKIEKNISKSCLLKVLPAGYGLTLKGTWFAHRVVKVNPGDTEPGYACLCKQCRSRSVGFGRWSGSALFANMWMCINNLDQVIWLA